MKGYSGPAHQEEQLGPETSEGSGSQAQLRDYIIL